MGNELALYNRMANPLDAITMLGNAIAKSKMFGCENIEQGQVMAMECLSRGIAPLAMVEKYHIVEGKLMMKYDAMLAEFHQRGGKHRIVARTEDEAAIELTFDGQSYTERVTWADMQKEPTPFKGDGKTLKRNWATPRARRQMLWARAVSEGVRAILPDVNCGRYVPEEMDADSYDAASNGASAVSVGSNGNGNGSGGHAAQPAVGEVVDAEFTVVPTVAATPATPAADTTPANPKDNALPCTEQQRQIIESFWGKLGILDDDAGRAIREKQLRKRGASLLRNLTIGQANEFVESLSTALVAKQEATEERAAIQGEPSVSSVVGQARPDAEGAAYTWSPAGEVLVGEIKALLTASGDKALVGEIKTRLVAAGLKSIADMNHRDATRLKSALTLKTMKEFFGGPPFDKKPETPFG